jgi:hypothetical protein
LKRERERVRGDPTFGRNRTVFKERESVYSCAEKKP